MKNTLQAIEEELLEIGHHGERYVNPLEESDPIFKLIRHLQNSDYLVECPDLFEGYNFEDFIFDNMPDYISEDINEDFRECINSYNWAGPIVFQIRAFTYHGENYVALSFHKYGDVRANYTQYVVFEGTKQNLIEVMYDFQIKIPTDTDWYITQSLFSENGYINAWNSTNDEDYEGYYESDDCPEEVKLAVSAQI